MNVKEAYNIWSEHYDTNQNKTRDLEAFSLRQKLKGKSFRNCLEIGCGTGKNTEWLISIAEQIVGIDLSEEMLAKAKQKVGASNVKFIQADINSEWNFTDENKFELAIFSLVLEHIDNLHLIFQKLNSVMDTKGVVYIGELHPFKQYSGPKARFENAEGPQIVSCFNHNVSDFMHIAKKYNFQLTDIDEYFDENDKKTIPRILTLMFKKK